MTDHFARVLSAFRGERFPLDKFGMQSLWFAVQADSDYAITPESFTLDPVGLDYPLDSAPGVVGFLLERVGSIGSRTIRTWIASTKIGTDEFPPFTSPPRHVLIEAWTARVTIRIREHEAALDTEVPLRSAKRFGRFSHACPHCQEVPYRYRMLSDDSLVCLACGASSAKPPGARQH